MILMTAVLAMAQGRSGMGPGGGGAPPDPAKMIEMRVNMLATHLSLTDAQKTQATKIFTDAQTASQTARDDTKAAHESMRDAVKSNNTAAIDQLARDIGAATTQLTAIESKAQAAFYAILTAEQKTKMDSMPMRGAGGPGGFGMSPAGMGRGR